MAGDGRAGGAEGGAVCPNTPIGVSRAVNRTIFKLCFIEIISYCAEHGDGFQPVESLCFLKCVLVQKGALR
jgi:hypothetical protein